MNELAIDQAAWSAALGPDWDRVQEELAAAGLTDGLPVVPPTAGRIDAMLAHCRVEGNRPIATLPPSFSEVTWRDAAFNALMAGCKPEYLPVVAAAVDAMADPDFNLLGIATTTGSATPLVIVNGPIARAIGMNSGGNALGGSARANAAIGRAIHLVLQNAGGAKPGEVDMATLGQPGKISFCLAENERANPWKPFHVDRGFLPHASVVTVFGASGIVEVVDGSSATGEDLATTFAQSMLIAGTVGGHGMFGGGQPLIVMPPEHADLFHRCGYTREKVQAEIFERAQLPADRLSSAIGERIEKNGNTRALVRVATNARDVLIVVAGGVGRKAAYIPSWSGSTRAISREVREIR